MTSSSDNRSAFDLLLILPPYLMQEKACVQLFPAAKSFAASGRDTIARFGDPASDLTVIDISGQAHRSFNHALLSSNADAALIIVDGAFGLEKRSLWVKLLACLAALPDIIIAIDNMALADYSRTHFEALRDEFEDSTEFGSQKLHFVPIDMASSDNLNEASKNIDWYEGQPLLSLVEKIQHQQRPPPTVSEPAQNSDQFAVHLCWIADAPMLPGRHYMFDNGEQQIIANISALKHRINPETMGHQAAKRLFPGNIGYGNLSLETAVPFAPFEENRRTGSFMLNDVETGEPMAFGLIKHSLRRATNIRWQQVLVDKAARSEQKTQKPFVLWFTGLSGSGKSTIAALVEKQLHAAGRHTYLLDGDNVRHGLCRDLGFTEADRVENIRRVGEISKLLVDAGLIVITSFISPFHAERRMARELMDEGEFIEVLVDTPLSVCEERDVKGLYKKARAGLIKNFTGLDSPYEKPGAADIHLDGSTASAERLASELIEKLAELSRIDL